METVKLINDEFQISQQKDVIEQEFQAVQAELVAHRTPLPETPVEASDASTIVDERRSSINLHATEDQDVQEERQEDVLDMDAWATRTGGTKVSFGPQAALAHYLGKLPTGAVVIIHKDFSPSGHFNVFALKSLSKILCLSTISQTTNGVILVKKSLATAVFSTGFRGKVLAHVGINQALGNRDPSVITQSLLEGELPGAKKRRKIIIKRIIHANQPRSS